MVRVSKNPYTNFYNDSNSKGKSRDRRNKVKPRKGEENQVRYNKKDEESDDFIESMNSQKQTGLDR